MSSDRRAPRVLAWLLVSATLAAQDAVELGQGRVAPHGTWYTRGGNACRSGESLTEPPRGEPVEVWLHDVDGEIEGEPLVWGDVIVLSVDRGEGRRALVWLDLESGERLGQKLFETDLPLEPSLWRNRVALRAERSKLECFRVGRSRLTRIADHEGSADLSPPLYFEGEVYFSDGFEAVRYDPESASVVWAADSNLTAGSLLSIRGDDVLCLGTTLGFHVLRALDRGTGERRDSTTIGEGEDATALIQLFEDTILVELEPGRSMVIAPPGLDANAFDMQSTVVRRLAAPVGVADGWLGFFELDEGRRVLLRQEVKPVLGRARFGTIVLASDQAHPEFLADLVPPTRVGDVILVGGRAFDLESLEILWDVGVATARRAVPVRQGFLLVDGASDLRLFRTAGASAVRTHTLVDVTAETELEDVFVVLGDGSVHSGDFVLSTGGEEPVLVADRGRESWPLSRVHAIVDEEDRLLHAVGGDQLELAIEALLLRRAADGYAELAHEARLTRDAGRIRELTRKARSLGSDDERLIALDEKAAELDAKPSRRIDEKRLSRLAEREAELETARHRGLWDFALPVLDDAPHELQRDLLVRALALEQPPAAAVALAWSQARLGLERVRSQREFLEPLFEKHAREGPPGKALEWIAYFDVVERHPVDFLEAPKEERVDMSLAERKLGRATISWRPDLLCAQSEKLRIITPLSEPGSLALCIDVGEFVCAKLDEIFAPYAISSVSPQPLVLHLYENERGFRKHAARRGLDSSQLAGYYSPSEDLQHIYMPEGKDAILAVLPTYAHELTHNWLQMQCPLFEHGKARRARGTAPGHWIVEGFATFVENARFDFESAEMVLWNPRAQSLDVVANGGEDLIPWESMLTMTQLEFGELGSEPDRMVSTTAHLGLFRRMSETRIFYEQAGATCRFLYFGEEGGYRAQLFDFISRHYSGEETLGIEEVFGLSADALGRKVEEFCRAVLAEN